MEPIYPKPKHKLCSTLTLITQRLHASDLAYQLSKATAFKGDKR
jgi:hypothetical protein